MTGPLEDGEAGAARAVPHGASPSSSGPPPSSHVGRPAPLYRLWVNDERTVFVRMWGSGAVEAAIRFDRGATWGPPVALVEEKV